MDRPLQEKPLGPPRLGIGLIWLSSTVWQFLSTCSLWQMASQEAGEDEFNDFDDFEIITD